MIDLCFSILQPPDFAHLADEVAATAERGGGTIVHVDVMDGHTSSPTSPSARPWSRRSAPLPNSPSTATS